MDSKTVSKIIFFSLILLGATFEVIGDIYFKKWSIAGKNLLFYVGIIAYSVGTIFWAFSLKYELLSKAVPVFMICNILIVILVGVFFFKEELSLVNKIGVMLGLASIFFLEA